jgi:hypothetical protein
MSPASSQANYHPVGLPPVSPPAAAPLPPPVALDRPLPISSKKFQANFFVRGLRWAKKFRRLSASVTSALLHVLAILILAILAIVKTDSPKPGVVVTVRPKAEALDDSVFDILKPATETPQAEDAEELKAAMLHSSTVDQIDETSNPNEGGVVALESMTPVEQKVQLDRLAGASRALAPLPPAFAHSSLEGRSTENRMKLAMSRGGSEASEKAVELALEWFTAHQHRDGGWSTVFEDPQSPCFLANGAVHARCRHGSLEHFNQKRIAATGLALLTYLGAGYTHIEGKYQPQVYRGLQFLMSKMQRTRPSREDQRLPGQYEMGVAHEMYEQGIASLAICEAYQMTHDKILEKPCQDATDFILHAQFYDGSWGYQSRTPGDLSIVGWQMMSLKSANASDLLIDTLKVRRVDRFLDAMCVDGIHYRYRGPKATRSMTAIGILMRLYLGYPRTDPRLMRGAQFVAEKGPSESDVYLNYYGSQALFQLESPFWKKWNPMVRDYLVQTQSKNEHETGSWFFEDLDEKLNYVGGRLYTTAMCAMTLEVYYRYMPVYQSTSAEPFKL